MSQRSKWSLIGVPDHRGVMNVGGRIGAAKGPAAFRRAFAKLNGRDGVRESMIDQGDAPLVRELAASHQQAAEMISRSHRMSAVSVILGGGHDLGFPHLKGMADALAHIHPKGKAARLGCINIDAHLDLRRAEPTITSGSPFFLAIESEVLDPAFFIEFGIQSHCNAPSLWEYADSKGVQIVPFAELRGGRAVVEFKKTLGALAARCDLVAISLDLDAASSAYAPGVSAPQAEGFTGSELIEMMEIAGAEPKASSLGVFELNPEHDVDDRTARLAATAVYHYVASALRAREA